MSLPNRQFLQAPAWVRSLPDATKLPITPLPDATKLPITPLPDATKLPITPLLDVTQIPTPLVYPDITQLSKTLSHPGISTHKNPSSAPSFEVTSSVVQDRPPHFIPQPNKPLNQSRILLYAKIVLLFLSNLVIPFLLYVLLDDYGFHITRILYSIIVILMLVNTYSIGVQTLVGLRIEKLPTQLALLYPPASAIIAAYLPNEVTTIVETIKAVLSIDYPGPFQVILAYNTPYTLPIESVLNEMAAHDRRLILRRFQHSNSKAENISWVLHEVTGTFVGIFDADHYPAPDSFKRAWHWLSRDYHVVQGRCVVRNGGRSWITRLVTIEFEMLYALEYSGRARMRNFGIFGGANGYWRTDLLRKIDMNSFMFAESIDSSMRALQQGYKIMHDPLLICRELAPETLQAFWNQRMRQDQGWFQVAIEHFWTNLFSPRLSFRQKLGSLHLLVGREIYIWLSAQAIPLLAFQVMHEGWLPILPFLIIIAAFTLGIHLMQVLLTYNMALPEIRRHTGWFVAYAVLSLLFFTELKNNIARIAQLKEFSGRRDWSVTPRSTLQKHAKRGVQ